MAGFSIPARFAEDINSVSAALTEYYLADTESDKRRIASRIFCTGCTLFNALNIDEFKANLPALSSTSAQWEAIDELFNNRFDEFLSIESDILLQVGIDERARTRILDHIGTLTNLRKVSEEEVVSAFKILAEETCALCRSFGKMATLEGRKPPELRSRWRWLAQHTFRILGGGVIIVNTALSGAVISLPVSGLSVAVGTLMMGLD